jgi:ketosteroid isomerase-like protein
VAADARHLVERLFAALEARDLGAVGAVLADDATYTFGGTSPLAGTASGRDEVLAKLQQVATWSQGTSHLSLIACHAAGKELALVHARQYASVAGDTIQADAAMVVRAHDGKLVEIVEMMEQRVSEFWSRVAPTT